MASVASPSTAKPDSRGRPSVVSYSPFDAKKDADVLRTQLKNQFETA